MIFSLPEFLSLIIDYVCRNTIKYSPNTCLLKYEILQSKLGKLKSVQQIRNR